MRHPMSLKSRHELLAATAPRYQAAKKKQKQRILDEFVAATGYHRHYAIPLLKQYQAAGVRIFIWFVTMQTELLETRPPTTVHR
jgi:hypothetical protein